MKKLLLVTLFVFVFGVVSSFATPITGGIHFAGLVSFGLESDGVTPISKADATMLEFQQALVFTADGSYANIPSLGSTVPVITPAVFNDFSFNPSFTTPFTLWTVTDNSSVYSFTLETISIVLQDATHLNLSGTGVLFATGYDDTVGTWHYSTPGGALGSGDFVFAASSAPVPEPTTLLLLGSGLVGLAFLRRRKS